MIVSIDLGFGAIPFCTIYGALMLGNNYTYTATGGGVISCCPQVPKLRPK